MEFVSRAGQKLQHALDEFKIDVTGKTCIDYGCSTGGFTDCLLQNLASRVVSIDTAYGELSWNLRNDPRVEVHERTNALYFDPKQTFDIATVDVGWTKQAKILPVVAKYTKAGADIISLLNPHYELGPKHLINGKVPKEELESAVTEIVKELLIVFKNNGLEFIKITKSPIVGDKAGNTEYLMWVKKL